MRRTCPPAVAVAVTIAALACAAPSLASGLTSAEQTLLGEMNQTRSAHGLPRLRIDWRLERAARAHSAEMLRDDSFGHGAFAWRMRQFGAVGPTFGENLAWGTGGLGAGAIVHMWLDSPGHRANLLRRGFRRVGVAAPVGEFLGYGDARVVTVDFAGN